MNIIHLQKSVCASIAAAVMVAVIILAPGVSIAQEFDFSDFGGGGDFSWGSDFSGGNDFSYSDFGAGSDFTWGNDWIGQEYALSDFGAGAEVQWGTYDNIFKGADSYGTEYALNNTGTEYALNNTGTEYALSDYGTEYALNNTGTEYALSDYGTEYALNDYGTQYTYDQQYRDMYQQEQYYQEEYQQQRQREQVYQQQQVAYQQPQPIYPVQPVQPIFPIQPIQPIRPAVTPIFPVTPQYPVQQVYPAPVCSLIATPSQVQANGSVTLIWSAANGVSASISGLGSVPLSGSRLVTVNGPQSWTLTVYGQSGQVVNCNAQVTVLPQPVPPPMPQAPYCVITVNQAGYGYGQGASITWNTTNATSAYIDNGIGNVPLQGSRVVTPNQSTVYTMTVYGNGGYANCQVAVNVNPIVPPPVLPPPPVVPPPQGLSCVLTAAVSSINEGQAATLSWTSTGAVSASLNDGIGSVHTNGTLTVNPESSRLYVLTVTGQNGQTAQCQAALNVNGSQYVSLSSVPYTGFDGGIWNVFFWFFLMSFAAGAAYLFVYGKGSRFAFAHAPRMERAMNSTYILDEQIVKSEDETPGEVETRAVSTPETGDRMEVVTNGDGSPSIVIARNY